MSSLQNLVHSSITIRPLTIADANSVAKVHAGVFPDYFLTHLGLSILELFYQEFAHNTKAFGFVAVRDAEIVGFVAGVINPSIFYGAFYRKNFGKLFLAVLISIIHDLSFAHELRNRGQHIFYALRSRFGVGREKKDKIGTFVGENDEKFATFSPVRARLLSIGILPVIRGMGAAEALVDHLGREFSLRGFEEMGLSVFVNNDRAISFYEKNGWQREASNDTNIYFYKPTVIERETNQL